MLKLSLKMIGPKLKPQLEAVKQIQARTLANDIFRGVKDKTPVDTGRAKRGWRMLKKRDGFTIYNPVSYTRYLEQGSSKQAPDGMVRPTINNLRARGKIK